MGHYPTLLNCPISKHKFAVVCANACSVQISLVSILSFMRVYIYCWDDKVRYHNIAGMSFFLRIVCVNTAVLKLTTLSKLSISSKL